MALVSRDRNVVNDVMIPENFRLLHAREEELRARSEEFVGVNPRLALHLLVVKRAINLADLLRQSPTPDEDLKVVQLLGMRVFNAFCACVKLAISGYGQASVLVLRDALETTNLLDLFSRDGDSVERFRFSGTKAEVREFSPFEVRLALDERDGREDRGREKQYKMLSELAAHPTMKSAFLMRTHKNGDAVSGPFVEPEFLEAVVCEFARIAGQAGEVLDRFIPETWVGALVPRRDFSEARQLWLESFPR